jgi:hypothetical protein
VIPNVSKRHGLYLHPYVAAIEDSQRWTSKMPADAKGIQRNVDIEDVDR